MMMKNVKKTYKKKTGKVVGRKSMPWRSTAIATMPIVGLGTSSTTILRTSFFANVTAAAGSGIFTGYLKPGSCFDPSGDISTMQPQFFDQFAAVYNRYKVNSCQIRMKINGALAGGAATTVWVGAGYPAVDSTALTTYQAAASQQYGKTTSGGFSAVVATAGVAGNSGKTLSFNLNHNAVVGAKSDTWDIGAVVTADPTANQFMVLPFFLQGNAAGAHTWVLEIDMFQNVTFSQKKNTIDA